MAEKKRDLTTGSISKGIIAFSVPIFLGYLFQNLYNSVDSMVVGQYVSKHALAAVTSCASVSNIIVGFFTGLSTGVTVILSKRFGAKEYDRLHTAIHTSILFSIIMGAVMAVLGVLLSPALLRAIDCPTDVFPLATEYLRLYLFGCMFTSIYNVASGVLRSVGDSNTPFKFLVCSSLINIVLDYFFVVFLKLGVSGVGMATIISQGVACLLSFRNLTKTNDVHKVVLKDLAIDGATLKEIINIGLPAALQTCLISLSNAFVQKYINGFEADAMAGVGAAQKVDVFVSMPAQSVGLAITTYVSQNLGAKREDRIRDGIKSSIIITAIATFSLAIPAWLFADKLVVIFNDDPNVIAYGVAMMKTVLPLYILLGLNSIYAGVVRGYGYSKEVMIISLFAMVLCRQVFLAVTMAINHSIYNVYIGYPFAWGITALITYIFYLWKIKGKTIKA